MSFNKQESTYILTTSKKLRAIELLGSKCCQCGNNNHICLEFHHKGDSDKEYQISDIMSSRWSIAAKELGKCSLVCRNCHMEQHYPEASRLNVEILRIMNKPAVCDACGYDKNYAALDFHHNDPSSKRFSFRDIHNQHMFLMPLDDIVKEMTKCRLLCRNCHAIEHYDIARFLRWKSAIDQKINSYKEHNPIDWDLVRQLKAGGMKNTEISKTLHCTKSSITYILKCGALR
jgi:hypothetical protein